MRLRLRAAFGLSSALSNLDQLALCSAQLRLQAVLLGLLAEDLAQGSLSLLEDPRQCGLGGRVPGGGQFLAELPAKLPAKVEPALVGGFPLFAPDERLLPSAQRSRARVIGVLPRAFSGLCQL